MVDCPDGHASVTDGFCDACGLLVGPISQAQPTQDPWGSPSRAPGAAQAGQGGAGQGTSGQGTANGRDASQQAGRACPNCGTPRVGNFNFCDVCGLNFSTGLLPDGRAPASAAQASAAPASAPQASAPAGTPYRQAPAPPDIAPREPTLLSQPGGGSIAAPAAAPQADGAPSTPSPVGRSVSSPPSAPSMAGGGTWTVVVSADRAYYDRVREEAGADAEGITFPAYCAERRFTLAGAEMRIGRHSASRGIYPEIDLSGPPTDPGISRLHAVLVRRADGDWAVLDPGSANGTMLNGAEIPVGEEVPLRGGDRVNVGAWTAITVQQA